ncbi:uncharacterized protein LOC122965554 [Thunnus albacares]|uniref:uncharacterized protein LOC122965554 n=1 Tax=Thunnus albacares TaxID=8236 RepID=UPI001CF70162|nr:uncharacterized protein LOC122965554 [Thunnus albacares]
MDEFRWIKISLFLILVLQFRAVTGQDSYITVRDGDEVTLPCKNVINDQDKCDHTTWTYSREENSPVVELIRLGQIGEAAKAKSDRLSVTADCSLVIKKVTVDDFGRYSCIQYDRSGQQQGQDAKVYLSVINIHEHQDDDKVTLTCSVLKYEYCQDTVEWLYDGNREDFTNLEKGSCGAAVKFTASNLNQTSHYSELFKCKVTERNGGTLLCDFTPQSSCEKPGNMTREENEPSARNDGPTKLPVLDWKWFVVMAVCLAALLIIVVAFIRWKKTKGNRTQMDDSIRPSLNPVTQTPETSQEDTADPEDGVSYASVNYIKSTNSKARVQTNNEGDDAVTYSTVKASSSSAGDSTDPSSLYATVNKPNNKKVNV